MTYRDSWAPVGKQAFRKAFNREVKRQADEETFGPKPMDGELIPPRPKRNQWNKIELTAELKEEIVHRIASGEFLKNIVNDERMPSEPTVYREAERDPEFGAEMKFAYRVAAGRLVDEMLEIADDATQDFKPDGSVNYETAQRSNLKINTRKWVVSKFDPARFSEKVQTDITSGGEKLDAKEISPLESARQVAFLVEMAKRASPAKED